MNNGIVEEDIEMIAEALLVDDCGDLLRSDSLDWENVRRLPQYQQILNNQAIVEKVKEFMKKYDELIQVTDYAPKMVDTHSAWIGTHEVLTKILETTLHSKSFGGKNHD